MKTIHLRTAENIPTISYGVIRGDMAAVETYIMVLVLVNHSNSHILERRGSMRLRKNRIFFAVMTLFLIWQVSTAGQKLRYHFEKGKTYKYTTFVESKTSGQSNGQEFTLTSGADFDYSLSWISADAGNITLKLVFDKFHIKLNMPMMGFNDSTIVMQEYVGKRIKVVVTESGKTLSVEPIDTIPPSNLQTMINLSPSELFKQILLELPEKEMNVNETWKKNNPDSISRSGLKMVVKPNIEFTIAGKEKKIDLPCWKITFNGTSAIEGSGSQRGADVTVDGTVKMKGTAYFAPAEGVAVYLEQSSDTDMTTTQTGSQTGAMTLSVSTKVKNSLVK
jgi:hypothetical protein